MPLVIWTNWTRDAPRPLSREENQRRIQAETERQAARERAQQLLHENLSEEQRVTKAVLTYRQATEGQIALDAALNALRCLFPTYCIAHNASWGLTVGIPKEIDFRTQTTAHLVRMADLVVLIDRDCNVLREYKNRFGRLSEPFPPIFASCHRLETPAHEGAKTLLQHLEDDDD